MKVWVTMGGKDDVGLGSIHASLAGAYGACRKFMDEIQQNDPWQEWYQNDEEFIGLRPIGWPYNWRTDGYLYSCWIEEIEVRP